MSKRSVVSIFCSKSIVTLQCNLCFFTSSQQSTAYLYPLKDEGLPYRLLTATLAHGPNLFFVTEFPNLIPSLSYPSFPTSHFVLFSEPEEDLQIMLQGLLSEDLVVGLMVNTIKLKFNVEETCRKHLFQNIRRGW